MTPPCTDKESLFYNNDDIYGFTLNPNDEHQLYKSKGDRLELVAESFMRKLLILKPYAKYRLVVEVSEPRESRGETGRPRIHFHGTIKFKNCVKYLTNTVHELAKYASVVVSPYSQEWATYCGKQRKLMLPQLGAERYFLSDKDTIVGGSGDFGSFEFLPKKDTKTPASAEPYKKGKVPPLPSVPT